MLGVFVKSVLRVVSYLDVVSRLPVDVRGCVGGISPSPGETTPFHIRCVRFCSAFTSSNSTIGWTTTPTFSSEDSSRTSRSTSSWPIDEQHGRKDYHSFGGSDIR
eukprot:scaffold3627_cov124-Isochrysis_galbana.AAC.4